jgi:rubrerythrin
MFVEAAFNSYEALKIATEMERDGLAFYEALAAAVKEDSVKALALRLAEEERKHIRRFRELIDTEGIEKGWTADDLREVDEFLSRTGRRERFPGREAAKKIAGHVKDVREALSFAIHLERMTVSYYERLGSSCTLDSGKKAFAELVEEEKRHATDLEAARKGLGG